MFNLYKELTASEFMVLTFFTFSVSPENEISISLKQLENHLNLSKMTVAKALKGLEDKKFIQKINYQKAVSQHTPNSYYLTFDKRLLAETGW